MAAPDYVVCLECETPCYVFEWNDAGKLEEALCLVCGNDRTDEFATQEEMDEMDSGSELSRSVRRGAESPKPGPGSSGAGRH